MTLRGCRALPVVIVLAVCAVAIWVLDVVERVVDSPEVERVVAVTAIVVASLAVAASFAVSCGVLR